MLAPSMWWVWIVAAGFFWLVQLIASSSEVREGQGWSLWRTLAVVAMSGSLAIGLIRFVKWVWLWN
jgi:hypothetical protein